MEKFQKDIREFDFNIVLMEVCQKYPLIFIIGENKSSDKKSKEKYNFLFDFKDNDLLELESHVNRTEKRWSHNWEYFYYNQGSSITLIETKFLKDYLKSMDKRYISVEIKGHPLGLIWQENWVGHYLFYASGTGGGPQCWGLYDLLQKQNYFIKCCGMKKVFKEPCNNNTKEFKNLINYLTMKGMLIKISNDFYGEVNKIMKKNKELGLGN
jgi:hypothetical protein